MYIFIVLLLIWIGVAVWTYHDYGHWKKRNANFDQFEEELTHALNAGRRSGRYSYFESTYHEYRNTKYTFGPLIGCSIVMATLLAVGLFISAAVTYSANNVENSYYTLIELDEQRTAILSEFEDVLSDDGYVQLMHAAVPEDVKFLKHQDGVTTFMLGRADRIVEINQRYFAERNSILDEAKDVCNIVNNGFIPKFPILNPDCRLGEVLDLTTNR